ncbi:MAG TPA: glycosyltransferase family A protein [Opitutaceae bacterium]|nr:glycosyltransferase family A protein [Opitutaceae bacterium]
MSEPLFSIAIAAHNYAHYLDEAVRSVLAQTCGDYEILISDDRSADNTFSVAQRFAERDPRVRCWRNERNLGSRGNINKCYREARGRFVVPLQADDAFLRPDHLARIAAVVRARPAVGFVYTAGLFVTNDGVIARRYQPWLADIVGPGRFHLALLSRQPPWPSFSAIERTLLDRLGGEDEALVVADFELTMRLACHTEAAFLAAPAVVSRVHDQAQGIRVGCADETAVCRNNLACLQALGRRFSGDGFIARVLAGTETLYAGGHRRGNLPLYNAVHLAAVVNPVVARCRAQRRRLGLYAAGEHTRRLFEWTDLRPADVVCVMDGNPALHGTAVAGCRIVPPAAGLVAALDTVIISSASQQDEIYAALHLAMPATTELVTLYPRQFVGADEARAQLHPLALMAG